MSGDCPLAESVRASSSAAGWLAASDQAAVDLAVVYARAIDEALAAGEGADAVKVLGPHLLTALRALGCVPAERKALDDDAHVGASKLDKLKSGSLRAV